MKYKFDVGEKVLCFEPDETKARVLYNAKVMDVDMLKDSKGRKKVEYKIHFQGWNHAWDRWADETFVLKDDEQNRQLQRKLAHKAIKRLRLQKGRKRHHLPGIACKHEDGEMMADVSYSSEDSIESFISSSTNPEKKAENEDYQVPTKIIALGSVVKPPILQHNLEDEISVTSEELPSRRQVTLDIPASLRARLEDDFTMIKKRDMLINLPVCPNIVQILDNYVKKFAQQYVTLVDKQKFCVQSATQSDSEFTLPPEKRLNLCQEVCCDVKLLFDFALPLTLLYAPERAQFKHMMQNTTFRKEISHKYYIADTKYIDQLPHKSATLDESVSTPKPDTKRSHSENQHTTPKPYVKKKNAEAQLIEETHKYLIPNQPNLDQTGLSQDSQGRRRSSRLSHHETIPAKSSDALMPKSLIKEIPKMSDTTPGLYEVSLKPHVFLRAPTRKSNQESQSSGTQTFYKATPSMDRETYITSCGSDVKMIIELKKIWDWSILPDSYEPDDGAFIPPSLIYGIHHLLRFFVKLPDIMVKMEIPEYKVRVIVKHLQGLLKFLSEYERELFEIDCYVPSNTLTFD